MKKIVKYMLGMVLFPLVLSSCTDKFEDFNTDPNAPSKLDSEALIAPLIDCLASPEENPCQRNNTFWACFGGYVTVTNTWAWGDTNYYTYNVDDERNRWSADYYFNSLYKNYFSIARMTGERGPVYALALLFRVNIMEYVLTMQGPLPYSQVKDGLFTVPYDDEKTAYTQMFADLDNAIENLTQAAGAMTGGFNPLRDYDRVYDGDYSKWVKYANSLKLRMAIRISEADPELAHKKAAEAVQHPIGVMESASDTAWDKLNSRYKNGFNTVQSWGEIAANASITSYMSGYEDPRLPIYFTKATDGSYTGVRSGIRGIKPNMYCTGEQIASKMNVTETTPMLIFSAAEVAFLRAEAALKGWSDVGASAEEYYNKGITISFQERGVEGSAADYYNDTTRKPKDFADLKNGSYNCNIKHKLTIKWNDGASAEEKLERLIIQKWIANYPLGAEAWNDYRRTGYPQIFPAVDNLSTQGVTSERGQRRLRFSLTEYESNRANVEKAAGMIGADRENIDLWWAKKN